MNQHAATEERIFTEEEAARFIRRRQRRLWAVRMVLAVLLLVTLIFGPPVFLHLQESLWLTMLGANVDWSYNDDNWREGGVTYVSFPLVFRTNGDFKNDEVARLRKLHRLETLDLSNAYDVSSLGLADLKKLPYLRVLDLARIEDTASQVVAPPPKFSDGDLVQLEPLTDLRELSLAGNPITDNGLAHIANLKNLEWLDLEETRVTDEGLARLKGLTKLKVLRLGKAKGAKTVISPNAAAELNRALPDAVIHLKKEYEPE